MQHYSLKNKLKILERFLSGYPVEKIILRYSIHKSTLYRWKKQFEFDQALGLKRRSRVGFIHPQKLSLVATQKIIDFSITHPNLGPSSFAKALSETGLNISSTTVYKLLTQYNLRKETDRIYALEQRHIKEGLPISQDNFVLICKLNPCFKHYKEIGQYPGEILVQDTLRISKHAETYYLYVVIDTYSFYSFISVAEEMSADIAIDLLSRKTLRFFRENGCSVNTILTSKRPEFTKFNQRYNQFLADNNISRKVFSDKSRNWHGYIETIKRYFIEHNKEYAALDSSARLKAIKSSFRYINKKNKKGFPTFGKSPLTIMSNYLEK